MKTKLKQYMVIFFGGLGFFSTLSWGGGISPIHLDKTSTNAPLIIVASGVDFAEATTKTNQLFITGAMRNIRMYRTTLAVEKVIKGHCSDKKIVLEFPGPLVKNEYSINDSREFLEKWFRPTEFYYVYKRIRNWQCPISMQDGGTRLAVVYLKKGDEKVYHFVGKFKSVIRLANQPIVKEKMNSPSFSGTPEEKVEQLITISLPLLPAQKVEEAIWDLVHLRKKKAAPILKDFLKTVTNPSIKENILRALIILRDYSKIKESLEFLNEKDENGEGKELLSMMMSVVKDPKLVAKYYFDLLDNPHDYIRRDAAKGIEYRRSYEATPKLIKALSNKDPVVRQHCLNALNFLYKKKSKSIYYWRTWWENNGRKQFERKMRAMKNKT